MCEIRLAFVDGRDHMSRVAGAALYRFLGSFRKLLRAANCVSFIFCHMHRCRKFRCKTRGLSAVIIILLVVSIVVLCVLDMP